MIMFSDQAMETSVTIEDKNVFDDWFQTENDK